MTTENQIYRDLQKHLDKLPPGFTETESGVEINLVKRLFTPEEAKMATQLSMKPEPLERIYNRVKKSGISIEELQKILEQMVYKGIILASEEGYNERRYSNAAFSTGGIINFQLDDRLNKDLMNDFRQYQEEARAKASPATQRIPPLRTVPVRKSIPLPDKSPVSHYDDVRKLIEGCTGPIAVASCICRQSRGLYGESCAKTELIESCLMIGPDHARRHIEMGIGRSITKEEALGILDKAQEAGLVLQPENSQKPEAICCCCGDCCAYLKPLKIAPRPADLFLSNFYVEVDPELCNGCQECVERCQLEARAMVDDVATVNLDRCIGCGNCVVICPTNANQIKKKEEEFVPLKDKETVNMKILSNRVGKWNMFKIRMKMLLGLTV